MTLHVVLGHQKVNADFHVALYDVEVIIMFVLGIEMILKEVWIVACIWFILVCFGHM